LGFNQPTSTATRLKSPTARALALLSRKRDLYSIPHLTAGKEAIEKRLPSTVGDHDLSEVATALEMAVGHLSLSERECPIDHRAQAVQCDGPVHRLEIGAAPDADRAERDAAPAYVSLASSLRSRTNRADLLRWGGVRD
jgi:hypothetical protein